MFFIGCESIFFGSLCCANFYCSYSISFYYFAINSFYYFISSFSLAISEFNEDNYSISEKFDVDRKDVVLFLLTGVIIFEKSIDFVEINPSWMIDTRIFFRSIYSASSYCCCLIFYRKGLNPTARYFKKSSKPVFGEWNIWLIIKNVVSKRKRFKVKD